MCPLQDISDTESLSSALHGVNACLIHHPSNVENCLIGNMSETGQPKKGASELHIFYFYTFLQIFGSNFKILINTEILQLFQHLGNWHLTAQQMVQR